MKRIRIAARAVIIHEGSLLTVTLRDDEGDYHLLPGGGQRHGETVTDALRRECLEEIGCEVKVGSLLFVRDYIGRHHTFADRHSNFHQIENVFRCYLSEPKMATQGYNKDLRQVGIRWLPLVDLPRIRFYPEAIKRFFENGEIDLKAQYLGDVN